MGTRCAICIENSDYTVEYVYCHYDGYPEHMIPILEKYYSRENQVRELIALGDLRFCGSPEETEAYHRDSGEDLNIRFAKSMTSEDWDMYSYVYLFKNGQWIQYEC